MPLPTIDELATELLEHVDAKADQAARVRKCVEKAVAYVTLQAPNTVTTVEVVDGYVVAATEVSPLGDLLYEQEVIELGAELFWRRQAKNGIVSVNTLDGNPIRISSDPYKASAARIATLQPWGFA